MRDTVIRIPRGRFYLTKNAGNMFCFSGFGLGKSLIEEVLEWCRDRFDNEIRGDEVVDDVPNIHWCWLTSSVPGIDDWLDVHFTDTGEAAQFRLRWC